jgi:hypothetical protein
MNISCPKAQGIAIRFGLKTGSKSREEFPPAIRESVSYESSGGFEIRRPSTQEKFGIVHVVEKEPYPQGTAGGL